MAFKRLSDFLKEKQNSRAKVGFTLQDYREHVLSNFSSFVLKNEYAQEVVKNVLNVNKIRNILQSVNYPFCEAFCIAAKAGNLENLGKNLEKCISWGYKSGYSSAYFAELTEIVQNYQAKHLGEQFGPFDVDMAVDSLVAECLADMNLLVAKIEQAAEQIDFKNNIVVKALVPEDEIYASNFEIVVESINPISLLATKTESGFKFSFMQEGVLPDALKGAYENLLQKLKENPAYKHVVSLYMAQSPAKRQLFEKVKQDVCLGMQSVLPKDTTLTNMVVDETCDYWRVKVPKNYLVNYLQEGDMTTYCLVEDAPIRWLELVQKGSHEK